MVSLADLPNMNRLLESAGAKALSSEYGRQAVSEAFRDELDLLREAIRSGMLQAVPEDDSIAISAKDRLVRRSRPGLRRVINATGIVLHTNLGRAPMAQEAIEAVARVAAGYSNLEFDLNTGRRGSRTQSLEPLLSEVSGAEAALAVNNGAAAILLALSALSQGGEVVVSRGELVEIGGGFRIPDVIRQGGARLVEVGSTNKTRLSDYESAITDETRILLKVHQSNFRTIGFVADVGIAELAGLAKQRGLALVVDLGSGLLHAGTGGGEPTINEALAAGADLVTCSGDKLLGGPQAGLVLGSKTAVAPLRSHPLLRAMRMDKMSLAALEATIRLHRDQPHRVPVMGMIGQDEAALQERAEKLRVLAGVGEVVVSDAYVGGGSLPEERVTSRALALDPSCGAEQAAALLRAAEVPVVGRINKGRLLLDMLTVSDSEVPGLAQALRSVTA